MFLNLFMFISLASLASGEKGDMTVHQTPHNLIINYGESAEIKCFHKIPDYDRLLWYKQSHSKELTFMGNLIDLGLKQSPHLFVTENLNVTIKCSQIGTSHNGMYWFRKTPTEPLEQIVYFYIKSEEWAKNFKQRASAVRNGASLDLTLVKIGTSYNGMYWFRQTHTNSLEQIVYFFVQTENWEKNFKERASAMRNGASLDLTLVKFELVNMRVVIIITVTLITFSGFSHSNKVDQSPSDLIRRPGESAKIQCLHSVSGYNQINWYRQKQGQEFTFMGYLLRAGPNPEKEFTEKIDMSGNGNSNGSLIIKNLQSSDSGMYFCAAYHTVF
ncbi:TCR beta variable [Labeo rohita]|nr:TCR beta variable [Labeo rohita]